MSENYRLQLLSHGDVFPTREAALEYIENQFKYTAKWAEPALFFYGTDRDHKMILAVGSTKESSHVKSVNIIDEAELRELIENKGQELYDLIQSLGGDLEDLSNSIEQNADDISQLEADLKSTYESAGLTFDDNKILDRVTYEPGNDAIIGEASTLAEAIKKLSEFIQDVTIDTKNTNSVILKYVEEDGHKLTADVRIARSGDNNTQTFDDNIIGVLDDEHGMGLYATTDLEYNSSDNTLTFTSSGVVNGRFTSDAKRKVFDLGKHSIYTEDNVGHTVSITIVGQGENGKISADVNVSNDNDNVLVVKDNALLVKKLGVVESNTLKLEYDNNGKLKGNVKLDPNQSIIDGNDGIRANVALSVDQTNNTLTFTIGNSSTTYNLPGVNFIDHIEYDDENKSIRIYAKGQSEPITIDMQDLISVENWDVKNNANSSVVLVKETPDATGGEALLSADVKVVVDTDNLIVKDENNGFLSVSKETVIGLTSDAIAAKANASEVYTKNEVYTKTECDDKFANKESLTATINDLEDEINDVKRDVADVKEDVAEYGNNISSLSTQLSNVYTKTQIDEKVSELQSDIDTKAESENVYTKQESDERFVNTIEVQPNAANNLAYDILADGVSVGTITIPEDKFLRSVDYDSEHHILTLTFDTADETNKSVLIHLDDLVDTYSAGQGLMLDNNGEFSIKLAETVPSATNYLDFVGGALTTVGLDNTFAKQGQLDTLSQNVENNYYTKSELYTKTQVDEKLTDKLAEKAKAFTVSGSNGIRLSLLNYIDTLDDIHAELVLDNTVPQNALQCSSNGLFVAPVSIPEMPGYSITYEPLTNKIYLKKIEGSVETVVNEVQLGGPKIISNIEYLDSEKSLIVYYQGEGETQQSVPISLEGLMDVYEVVKDADSNSNSVVNVNVVETYAEDAPGINGRKQFKVGAQLSVINSENNAIEEVTDTNTNKLALFVNKNPNITIGNTTKSLYTWISDLNNAVSSIDTQLTNIINRITNLENTINGSLENLEARVARLERFNETLFDFNYHEDTNNDGEITSQDDHGGWV